MSAAAIAHKIAMAYRAKPELKKYHKLVPAHAHLVRLIFAGVLTQEDVNTINKEGGHREVSQWMERTLTICDVPFLERESAKYQR